MLELAQFSQSENNDIYELIANALSDRGYLILPKAFGTELMHAILRHVKNLGSAKFDRAGVGRNTDFHLNQFIRTDEICWLDRRDLLLSEYFAWVEALRLYLNQTLFLGLFDYECHLAHYPANAFYKKHLDAFRGQSNRVVTTILYLNPNWSNHDGGELIIYDQSGQDAIEIVQPTFGKLVIFLSEEFPHEVATACADRYSLTGWFRANKLSV